MIERSLPVDPGVPGIKKNILKQHSFLSRTAAEMQRRSAVGLIVEGALFRNRGAFVTRKSRPSHWRIVRTVVVGGPTSETFISSKIEALLKEAQ